MNWHQQVIDNQQINQDCFYMELYAPGAVVNSSPGQFYHLQVRNGLNPLLRRPISINYLNPEKGILGFLYQVKGEGTRLLSEIKVGSTMDILGPLGNGFNTNPSGQNILLVGGGIGVAPLFPLAQELRELQKNVTVLIGARTKEMVLTVDRFIKVGCLVHTATDDGSLGLKGHVSDLLNKYLKDCQPDFAYLCGPEIMLAGGERICLEHSIPGQVSIEAHMGCGVGSCFCCSHEKTTVTDGKYVRVCIDGPVFNFGEVKLCGAS